MTDKILVVVPAYNEAPSIGRVLDDLSRKPYTILVIDDGSVDETERTVQEKGIRVIRHVVNVGLGAAIATGFEVARREDFDILITFDADGQHNPDDIDRLTKVLDDSDVVIGVRSVYKERMPYNKQIGNWFLNLLTYFIFGVMSKDSQSGLRAFNKKAINVINVKSNRYEVSSELLYEARQNDLTISEVPVEVIYTKHSIRNGTNIFDGFKILWRMLLHKPGGRINE